VYEKGGENKNQKRSVEEVLGLGKSGGFLLVVVLKQLDEKPGVVVMVSTDALLLDGADQPASSAINVFVTGQPGLFDYYANHHSYYAIFSSVFFFFFFFFFGVFFWFFGFGF